MILNTKRSSEGVMLPDFKLYYRAKVMKNAWYWYRNKHIGQWNQIKNSEINPHTYVHLTFERNTNRTMKKGCWSNYMSACRKMQLDPYLSPYMKLKSK